MCFLLLFQTEKTLNKVRKMATNVNVKNESLLENTIESLQCSKCKAVPGFTNEQQNRYSCLYESHQLCEKCKSVCKCGSVVGKRPNPALKQILKNLPVYCPHYNNGCREIFNQAELLNDHQEGCVFRQVWCPDISCSNKVLFKDVIDHLNQNHQIKFFYDAKVSFFHQCSKMQIIPIKKI